MKVDGPFQMFFKWILALKKISKRINFTKIFSFGSKFRDPKKFRSLNIFVLKSCRNKILEAHLALIKQSKHLIYHKVNINKAKQKFFNLTKSNINC